jgi:hypothetical protein
MKSYKVRFNLSRGKNYMKWKVQRPDGTIEYHSPTDVQLVMRDCTLKNYKKAAQKIYDGGEKVVCAWVLCKRLAIVKSDRFIQADLDGERVRYNPRVTPHWMLDGENVDGMSVDKLVSVDFGLYKINLELSN